VTCERLDLTVERKPAMKTREVHDESKVWPGNPNPTRREQYQDGWEYAVSSGDDPYASGYIVLAHGTKEACIAQLHEAWAEISKAMMKLGELE
jgi:hypothetical protein